ncbi:hypothetical protein [Nocardioides deserti]|uniref:Uncharacterized protein n=1 Tax=Nocardioides deserti TaxID=1588644 RepID=A0ABR6U8E3_9ACTN|nr:hypothetical protein [Nocardioides deserti]MBC2960408.1 hypothetical protein [Nocardioides deserti]GGO71481.1 hypothetical protein GCM10012276_12550 [Nocardioides deserti]
MTELRSSFGVDTVGAEALLADRSCGTCEPCAAGAALWCRSPHGTARTSSPALPGDVLPALRSAVLAVAALLEAPAARTTLVVGHEGSATLVLARLLVDGTVLAAPSVTDPDLKAQVAAREASGRASVVVAADDVRSAVRAVRRGGHVCVPGPAADLPSVTELVQREVTLLAPQQVTSVLERLTEADWAAAVAAARTAA